MSSRRRRSRSSSEGRGATRMSDDRINDLISKLQHILPEFRLTHSHKKVSSAMVLQETCNYIRNLHREVDDLSERLAELLDVSDTNQAAIIRTFINA